MPHPDSQAGQEGIPAPVDSPPGRPLPRQADLALGAAAALAAALAVVVLPSGSTLRLAVAAPVLLVAPGYLLLQALIVPRPAGGRRALQGLLAIGLSPGIVGLLALSTSLVRGGFKPTPILVVVTGACLALAAIAFRRRAAFASAAGKPDADAAVGGSPL